MLWVFTNKKIWGLKIDGFTVQLCQTKQKKKKRELQTQIQIITKTDSNKKI